MDFKEGDIKLEKNGEVEKVKFVNLDEFKELISGKSELVVPHKEEYAKLIEYI
jgi:hypothetical protein